MTAETTSTRRNWLFLVIALIGITAFLALANAANAAGSTRFGGIAYFAAPGECTDAEGAGANLIQLMTGDLEGCLYIFTDFDSVNCTQGGVYSELGREVYVGSGAPGDSGTFETTYRFTAKFPDYESCMNFEGQINGRCQHPFVPGSGTGDFEGVSGRFDMKDNVEEGFAVYRGNMRFGN